MRAAAASRRAAWPPIGAARGAGWPWQRAAGGGCVRGPRRTRWVCREPNAAVAARHVRRVFAVAAPAAGRCDRAPPRLAVAAARAAHAGCSAAPGCAPAPPEASTARASPRTALALQAPAAAWPHQRGTRTVGALFCTMTIFLPSSSAQQRVRTESLSAAKRCTLLRTNAVEDEAVGALALDVQEGGHAALVDGHAGAGARHGNGSAEKWSSARQISSADGR